MNKRLAEDIEYCLIRETCNGCNREKMRINYADCQSRLIKEVISALLKTPDTITIKKTNASELKQIAGALETIAAIVTKNFEGLEDK